MPEFVNWEPAVVDIRQPQGSTFDPVVTFENPDGSLMNFTGYTGETIIRDGHDGPAVFTLNTANGGMTFGGPAGTIAFLLTPVQLAAWAFEGASIDKAFVYQARWTEPGGKVRTFYKGAFVLERKV
jgi:hypothetical protein